MNRQRLFSILWAVEFILGVLPAAVLLIVSFVPYLVMLPAVPSMLFSGNGTVVRSAIVLNGTMIGGILGIVAILMAYRPEKLRQSPKRTRLSIVFGCAGICAEALYFMSGGLSDVGSHVFARWAMLGPLIVGAHCAFRVLKHPSSSTSSPADGVSSRTSIS
jgi:hypothetical protein